MPPWPRRVSGYAIDWLLPERGFDVARSLVGSEGSCAIVTSATLRLIRPPAARVLLVVGFPDDVASAVAVGALLPHVLRLNEREQPGVYAEVARAMGTEDPAGRLEELCLRGGFANSLAALGLKPSDWPQVCEVMNRYGSHRKTNPAEVTDAWAQELYEISTRA
jgi:FAD/FMN-containing dehydrogenase